MFNLNCDLMDALNMLRGTQLVKVDRARRRQSEAMKKLIALFGEVPTQDLSPEGPISLDKHVNQQ